MRDITWMSSNKMKTKPNHYDKMQWQQSTTLTSWVLLKHAVLRANWFPVTSLDLPSMYSTDFCWNILPNLPWFIWFAIRGVGCICDWFMPGPMDRFWELKLLLPVEVLEPGGGWNTKDFFTMTGSTLGGPIATISSYIDHDSHIKS